MVAQAFVDQKRVPLVASYRGMPGLGFHTAAKLEIGAGTDAQTYYGGVTGIHWMLLS